MFCALFPATPRSVLAPERRRCGSGAESTLQRLLVWTIRHSRRGFAAFPPGVMLSSLVAVAAVAAAPLVAGRLSDFAMVIALLIGIALNSVAERPLFQPGIVFPAQTVLRWAVALLGLRIALGEIAALGATTAILVILAMAATLVAGFALARLCANLHTVRWLARDRDLRRFRHACTDQPGLQRGRRRLRGGRRQCAVDFGDAVHPLIKSLGSDQQLTGVMFGATIHDVAQVVGAGYAVSNGGNTAVIVKLFRVLLLFPVVVLIGWMFARRAASRRRQIPIPVFALVFVAPACSTASLLHSPPSPPGIRANCCAAGRGVDLGPVDRDRGARARHLADRHCQARLASSSRP